MSDHIQLTNRQQQVLRATVHHYVVTAEPVGSKVISEEYNLNASPATIRNAMGKLEKAGLLFQPHTSAGRIPSDSGYRLYVDHLIDPAPEIGTRISTTLAEQLPPQGRTVETLLRRAAQILSSLSGYVTLVTLPQQQGVCLRHLQLVQVSATRIMLIVVTDNYATQSHLIDLPPQMQATHDAVSQMLEDELQILSNFLNDKLKGKSLQDLVSLDWSALDREFQHYGDVLQASLVDLARRSQPNTYTHILVSGLAEMLRQPEFSVANQAQIILQLLEEEQEQLWPLIFDAADAISGDQRRVNVWIGSENPLEPMRSCALVSATYHRDSVPVGSVGMLGPTRMMYDNAIALVEAAADYLSEAIS